MKGRRSINSNMSRGGVKGDMRRTFGSTHKPAGSGGRPGTKSRYKIPSSMPDNGRTLDRGSKGGYLK